MTRLAGAAAFAMALMGCSAPGSLFSLEDRVLAVGRAKIEQVSREPAEVPMVHVAPALEAAPGDQSETTPADAPRQEAREPPPDDEAAAPVLVATAKQTLVFARPSFKAPKLGYLRAGAVVARGAEPAGFDGCRQGFYPVAPEGYVCVGNNASIDPKSELARAVPRRADRTAAMPYEYGAAASAGAPLYSRIPTAEEQRRTEPGFAGKGVVATSFDGLSFDGVPWFLADGGRSIATNGSRFSSENTVLGRAIAKSAFAFVSLFESGGRRFGLTADMAVVPLDRLNHVAPSRFHGLPLGEDATLPVVFVRSSSAALYAGNPLTGLGLVRKLERREIVPITGRRVRAGTTAYLETTDGHFIVEDALVRIDTRTSMPPWAVGDRSWLDVSIDHQSLVAYRGARPVFVTLVSTGVDGKGDPETTHSTIQGQFLIHTKHVTITMDGDEVGDEFDFRDVPYVQYFKDGFAFHAAYWHDGFGTARSHGCVNLSPLDARWLFDWTEPSVPMAWHGAMSSRGTLVSIHP